MAQLVKSSDAPSDAREVVIGHVVVSFSDGPVETDDAATIATAYGHPWLDVKLDEVVAEGDEEPTAEERKQALREEAAAETNALIEDKGEVVAPVEDAPKPVVPATVTQEPAPVQSFDRIKDKS